VLPLLAAAADERAAGVEADGLPCPVSPLPCGWPAVAFDPGAGIASGFGPFLDWAWTRVETAIAGIDQGGSGLGTDGSALESQFRNYLRPRLYDVAVRCFIVRLNAAKRRGQLRGDTPEARFGSWAREELEGGGLVALLDDFPGLARSLAATATGAASAWAEMAARLAADWPALRRMFAPTGGPDLLTGVRAGLGDTHRRGRTVMRVSMESGLELFYKPRDMGADAHVQDLIAWLGDRGLDPAPRTVRILDRGDHGWMEAVDAAPCRTGADVRAFYRRLGSLLLVVHLVDGSDVHCENVIAAGEHPVLVDLETVFQARPAGADSPRDAAFHDLVLATMLLPARGRGPLAGLDGGGLSDLAGQTAPRVADLCDRNTDTMRIGHREVELQGHDNVPRLDGRAARAADHVDDIVAGFAGAHRCAVAHREALLAENGPIDAFRDDRVRHILRGTEDYAVLLRGSYHPSCLRDAVHRGFVFDALWLATLQEPHLQHVVPSEQQDLLAGDVPYFAAPVAGRHLLDSRGRVIENFLATSGLSRVTARVEAMDDDDLLRQVACIRGSFAAAGSVPPAAGDTAPAPPMPPGTPRRGATPSELVDVATGIGEHLARLALVRDGEAHWTGLVPVGRDGFEYTTVGPDLYEGTAGVALFLAYLARATGRSDFEALARAAQAGATRQLLSPAGPTSIGAFTGSSGALYSALHLSELTGDAQLVAAALPAVERIARRVRADRDFDAMGGAAGCLLVMLRVAERHPSSPALAVATACGRHLLRHAVAVDGGVGWRPDGERGRPLLGLSHGAGGIAAALAQLSRVSPDRRFRRTAGRALAYERAGFVPAEGNWPDFRGDGAGDTDGAPGFMWAWCHGAPGIGMARLATPVEGDEERRRSEVAAALAGTAAHGFGGPDILCHGALGNLDLLLLAAAEEGERASRYEALRRAEVVVDRRRRTGAWRFDKASGLDGPGLMTGIAGIGYQLLRLADPEAVPSVLTLEGPRP
jgi:type 2 lantibiotic biosynthesis protein LanM